MSETLYRIKPLVWVENDFAWGASTEFCEYEVEYWDERKQHYWRSSHGRGYGTCDSLEHGKQLAQQHWEATLATILEPVETAEASDSIPVSKQAQEACREILKDRYDGLTPTEGHTNGTQQGRPGGHDTQ